MVDGPWIDEGVVALVDVEGDAVPQLHGGFATIAQPFGGSDECGVGADQGAMPFGTEEGNELVDGMRNVEQHFIGVPADGLAVGQQDPNGRVSKRHAAVRPPDDFLRNSEDALVTARTPVRAERLHDESLARGGGGLEPNAGLASQLLVGVDLPWPILQGKEVCGSHPWLTRHASRRVSREGGATSAGGAIGHAVRVIQRVKPKGNGPVVSTRWEEAARSSLHGHTGTSTSCVATFTASVRPNVRGAVTPTVVVVLAARNIRMRAWGLVAAASTRRPAHRICVDMCGEDDIDVVRFSHACGGVAVVGVQAVSCGWSIRAHGGCRYSPPCGAKKNGPSAPRGANA